MSKDFKPPHLCIFGSGRSGTTLLASMLNASEQIFIPYESYFLIYAYPIYHAKTAFSSEDYRQIAETFIKWTKRGWEMTEDYLTSVLVERQPQSFYEVNAAICEAFHRQENTEALKWGIKTPIFIFKLNRVRDTLAEAKLVHSVRDGRDVYLSYQRVNDTSGVKFGPKGVIKNALYWVDALRRVETFLKQHPEDSIYEVNYTQLLSQPEQVLGDLCRYLEIEYSPDMHENFNACALNQKVATKGSRTKFHKKLGDGLDANNTKKYKTKMSKRQIWTFEIIAVPYLLKYGYPAEYPYLNSPLFSPLRWGLYAITKAFIDQRYRKREQKIKQATTRSGPAPA